MAKSSYAFTQLSSQFAPTKSHKITLPYDPIPASTFVEQFFCAEPLIVISVMSCVSSAANFL